MTRIYKNLISKRLFPLAFLALGVLLLSGCSSGKKALERGQYDKAVMQSVKRLRSDAHHKKAAVTIRKAYKLSLDTHEKNILAAKNSLEPYRWERVLAEYRAINMLHDEIQRCPACLREIPEPRLVIKELNEARLKAAAKRYEMAEKALGNKEKRSQALEAYGHLTRVNELMPDYRNTNEMLEEAIHHSTLHVVVEPIPAPNLFLQVNHGFFINQLNEHLQTNPVNPFVCFYTPEEAEALDLGWIDHRIRMQFDQFMLGNIISNSNTEEVSRDSVLLNPKDDNKVYGTVSAQFTTREKSLVGSGLLDFKIIDPGLNRVLSQEKFPSEFVWATRWASYSGDERALSKEQRRLANRKEIPIPNPQYMFEEFAAPLFDQVVRKINDFYRDY